MGVGPDQDPFARDFAQDIIPYIEKHYNVSNQRESRALAGLSMGGIEPGGHSFRAWRQN
ncbi:hypothetical protein GCM10027577_17140 [Spirosoma fluminis]